MNRLCQKTPEPSAGLDGTQARAPRLPVSLLNRLCIHLWTRSELNRLPTVEDTRHCDLLARENEIKGEIYAPLAGPPGAVARPAPRAGSRNR